MDMTERESPSLAIWGLFCLVFLGIPVVFCAYGFGQLNLEAEEQRREHLEDRLDQALSFMTEARDPVSYADRVLLQLLRRLGESSNPVRSLARYKVHLQQRFPGTFSFLWLDGNGAPVPAVSDWIPPRGAARMMFQAFRSGARGDWSALRKKWLIFRRLLGPLVALEDVTGQSRILAASHQREKAFVYVAPVLSTGQLIVRMRKGDSWLRLGIDDRLRFLRANRPDISVLVDDRDRLEKLPDMVSPREWSRIRRYFAAAPGNLRRFGSRIWGHRLLHPTIHLLAFRDDPGNQVLASQRQRLVVVLSLLFGIGAWLSFLVMSGAWVVRFSIPLKLTFLFLYTAGIPLGIMALRTYRALVVQRKTLETQHFHDMEDSLKNFDRKFPIGVGLMQKYLQRTIGRTFPMGPDLISLARREVDAIVRRFRPSTVGLIDEQGHLAFEERGGQSDSGRRFRRVLRQFYADVLRVLNQGGNDFSAIEEGKVGKMASLGGIDMKAILGDVLRSLNTLSEYTYGGRKGLQAIFPIYVGSGKARFLAVFGWLRTRIEWYYVQSFLRRVSRQLPGTRLYAFNPHHFEWRHPQDFPLRHLVPTLDSRLRTRGKVLRLKVPWGNQSLLVTGILGTELSEFSLFAFSSDSRIRKELAQVRRRLGMFAAAFLLITVMVAQALARSFLTPIAHLAEGLAAIKEQNYKWQVPVLASDELGDLSCMFNEMMEQLRDLESARTIQERLFPDSPLSLGDLTVYGTCQSATQVGGDYFDYFQPDENHLLVLLGDVSGHGVSAALVMGLAKGVVCHPNGPKEPAALLSALNSVLTGSLRRKKMMTCFCAIYHRSGTLRFCNAGQNDPFLIRDGVVTTLESRNFLLGIGAKATYTTLESTLAPGDCIVMYTDGMVEAIATDGVPIDIPRFRDALPSLVATDPTDTERAIRCWYSRMAAPGPQEDDISVVILARKRIP